MALENTAGSHGVLRAQSKYPWYACPPPSQFILLRSPATTSRLPPG